MFKMKKIGIIVGVIIFLLLIGGGLYLFTSKRPAMAPATQSAKPTSSSVFSSIQDALNRSLSLKCTYANGDIQTVAYIKNGEIRSDISSSKNPQANGSVLMKVKDKKMYYWNGTQGFMMTIPDVTVTPTATTATGSNTNAQNTINDLEKYKQNCQPADVSDSLFVLPTNVTFKDMSEMMKAMPTSMMPTSGANGSTGGYAIPTQYQQYMQK